MVDKQEKQAGLNTTKLQMETKRPEKPPVEDCKKVANGDNLKAELAGESHEIRAKHPTTYFETLVHFLKGNVGSGVFALPEGFKFAGIILGPILTVLLGFSCLYCEHVLLSCSAMLKEKLNMPQYPPFADTIQLGFQNGPNFFKRFARHAKTFVNISIITTHLGFCCVYFIFISSTSQQIMAFYGFDFSLRLHMVIVIFPLFFTSIIRRLKFLVPMSLIANILMVFGLCSTFYLITSDLPSISSRRFIGDLRGICLFYGTAMYSFEGIGLVLPLQADMKRPEQFGSTFGVLNVGMLIVIVLFTSVGFLGYLQFGDNVLSSITLSLPPEKSLSQMVKISIGTAILLTYALMFYVALLVIWPYFNKKLGPFKRPLLAEISCRLGVVIITFFLSEFIPHLGLFISLIGACSTTGLALGVPPLCDISLRWTSGFGKFHWRLILDILALTVGFLGFVSGTYFSVLTIIEAFIDDK